MIKSVYYHYNDFEGGIKLQKEFSEIKKNKIKYNAKKINDGVTHAVVWLQNKRYTQSNQWN